ncbi:MAG TPA: hypothetical protein VMJ31_11645 [Methylocystis sp.]|nr:hypothetical protein [Methylocystis sp.]
MPINVPAAWTNWANGTPKAFLDILSLEGGQGKLPVSTRLMGGSLGVYAVLQTADHLLEHSFGGSLVYGLASAALVGVSTALVLPRYDARDRIVQTVTALAGVGAVIALASIVLHFVFAVALPPPLPTERLVNFLLFPLCIWNFFAFAYIYRHAKLRSLPAFALSATFVIVVDFILGRLLH